MKRLIYFLAIIFLVLIAIVCLYFNKPKKDINIILISIDSLRADHLSCYGYGRKTSPNIDKLAGEGVLFAQAISPSSWTLPAHISILTSMYQSLHGVTDATFRLGNPYATLPEILQKNGYTTAAFTCAYTMSPDFGFGQGFDVYDHRFASYKTDDRWEDLITTPEINEAAIKWLNENFKQKFFLFIHYYDVHYDYIPPPPYDRLFDPDYRGAFSGKYFEDNTEFKPGMDEIDFRHLIALYDGEIAFTDKYIGLLLEEIERLGLYDNTLIIITSDHGDEFLEHGGKGHRHTLYDELIQVPFILRYTPVVPEGKKIQAQVRTIDIMPTILDILRIRINKEISGKSLLPLMLGKRCSLSAYSELVYPDLVSVRKGGWKLIYNLKSKKKELYNIKDDPGESVNLINAYPYKAKRLIKNVIKLTKSNEKRRKRLLNKKIPLDRIKLSEQGKERLKSLGYLN